MRAWERASAAESAAGDEQDSDAKQPAICKSQQLIASTEADLLRSGPAAESSQRALSSWDSSAWADAPKDVPLPPDRRLHEMHMKHFGSFLQLGQRCFGSFFTLFSCDLDPKSMSNNGLLGCFLWFGAVFFTYFWGPGMYQASYKDLGFRP